MIGRPRSRVLRSLECIQFHSDVKGKCTHFGVSHHFASEAALDDGIEGCMRSQAPPEGRAVPW
jgi:hypothetical protein